jgi:hypothetical protein
VSDQQKLEGEEKTTFADLDELQQEIEKRIRDNNRFLEKFLDDDFMDEEEGESEEEDGGVVEL